MAATETKKDTSVPTSNIAHSPLEIEFPSIKNLSSFIALPPNIAGIDIKKENSAATVREAPKIIPPKMVEPLLEVPGTNARVWKTPISKAVQLYQF